MKPHVASLGPTPIAPSLFGGTTESRIWLVVAGVALLTASAKIQIPWWPVAMPGGDDAGTRGDLRLRCRVARHADGFRACHFARLYALHYGDGHQDATRGSDAACGVAVGTRAAEVVTLMCYSVLDPIPVPM